MVLDYVSFSVVGDDDRDVTARELVDIIQRRNVTNQMERSQGLKWRVPA